MTNRERELAALGFEYAEGIELAAVIVHPATGREIRKTARGTWETQPWNDNYWKEFEDLLAAIRFATPPDTPTAEPTDTVRIMLGQLAAAEHSATREGTGDQTFRGVLADALDERDRPHEAELLRNPHQHVVVVEGYVRRGQWELNPLAKSLNKVWDAIGSYPDLYVPRGISWVAAGPNHTAVFHPAVQAPAATQPVFTVHCRHLPVELAGHFRSLLARDSVLVLNDYPLLAQALQSLESTVIEEVPELKRQARGRLRLGGA